MTSLETRSPEPIASNGTGPAPPDALQSVPGLVLPVPPSDTEKTSYVHRDLPVLVGSSLLSMSMLLISQAHFLGLNRWLLLFAPFLTFTVAYFLISLRVNLTSHDFDLVLHEKLVTSWHPTSFPSVDILLPICGESPAVLSNTWTHVQALRSRYKGDLKVYVLDDGDSPEARALAGRFDFQYSVRANRGWFKKAGNLRHGYQLSSGEFVVIFDADFAPRPDFLNELLPYMADDPQLGIVQSPQYFRFDKRQSWMERGAGAVQELFYRVVQVSRDRLNGAICVGSCAVYRRAALNSIGGTALIEHSEDVHTGFDLAGAGWKLRYVPLPLATGLCPSEPDAFISQQYRWCSGSMSLLSSRKFWRTRLAISTRLCYFSGFCYYLHTAVFSLVAPLIPIVLVVAMPERVQLQNYLWIIPSTVYNLIVFPLWNRGRYGPEALMAKTLYGWAHLFAIWDALRKRTLGWQPTGGHATGRKTNRVWIAILVWGCTTSAVWVGASAFRMTQYNPVSFSFLLFAGVLYSGVIAMVLASGAQARRLASES
ncbi:MAG TPA: glycosyltransferase family 2 protein [Acidimicrobiales bacterium]|nr:glycosyltransferase family 2 protein [Acidimicrobiales bacterium]